MPPSVDTGFDRELRRVVVRGKSSRLDTSLDAQWMAAFFNRRGSYANKPDHCISLVFYINTHLVIILATSGPGR
jgi:hypothetical protein